MGSVNTKSLVEETKNTARHKREITEIERVVMDLIERLQDSDALGQLNYKCWTPEHDWNEEPFGEGLHRAHAQALFDVVQSSMSEGFLRAGVLLNTSACHLKNYVIGYFAHHVMRCLFAGENEIVIPQYEGLEETSLKNVRFPAYNRNAISKFVACHLALPDSVVMTSSSEDDVQAALSQQLATHIIGVVQKINIDAFIYTACRTYQRRELQAAHHLQQTGPIHHSIPILLMDTSEEIKRRDDDPEDESVEVFGYR